MFDSVALERKEGRKSKNLKYRRGRVVGGGSVEFGKCKAVVITASLFIIQLPVQFKVYEVSA